jgi:hypothetical protein
MWGGDERMEEAKEASSLSPVPAFIEPIYNKNPRGF